jgi:hypothetical protein
MDKVLKKGDIFIDIYSVCVNSRRFLYAVFYTTSVNLYTDKLTKQEYYLICTCSLTLPLKITRRAFLKAGMRRRRNNDVVRSTARSLALEITLCLHTHTHTQTHIILS